MQSQTLLHLIPCRQPEFLVKHGSILRSFGIKVITEKLFEMAITVEQARTLVEGKPWHHSFEVVPGVDIKGTYDPSSLWNRLSLPERLDGKSLADVGASNGYFSFQAKQQGANVTAFDYRHKDNSGFGLLQSINGYDDIAHHHARVYDINPETYGQFDIVLCLGLLYHLSDPYHGLASCCSIAKEHLYIESYCIDNSSPELADKPIMQFSSDPNRCPSPFTINTDNTNFWGFTSLCLKQLIEDLGFSTQTLAVNEDRVIVHATRNQPSFSRLDIAYDLVPQVPPQPNNGILDWSF